MMGIWIKIRLWIRMGIWMDIEFWVKMENMIGRGMKVVIRIETRMGPRLGIGFE